MTLWLRQQWNDIKGNVKYAVVLVVGAAVVTGVVALTHGLLLWQQVVLAGCFVLLFGWALFATTMAWRRQIPASQVASVANTLEDAPHLLINYTSRNQGKVTFINGGPGVIVSPELGPLKWSEHREIGIMGSVGTILPHGQSEHVMLFETSPNHGGELYHFMRSAIPHDAETTVTATYEDARGRKLSREFTLTSEVDDKITWKPDPVKLLQA